ncbi:MAG: GAF domain-containing protein [Desulfurivibrionaceae bacterium]
MTQAGTSIEEANNDIRIRTSLIKEIYVDQYGSDSELLNEILADVADLYQGKWSSHQACQTGYHNLGHALDVALLTARMIGGWNKLNDADHPEIGGDLFLAAMAAALFHDSGYIKERGDDKGSGGKFSFNHEARSMALAKSYLSRRKWRNRSLELVPELISITRFHEPLKIEGVFGSKEEEVVARMMATADLVAQMADVDYMKRIRDLYAELKEAYGYEGEEHLESKGYKVFSSAQEMIDGTVGFYENFVLPRLKQLGRMDQYLVVFFGDGRNPYLENITANLSNQLFAKRNSWQRLGEVLKDLGMVTKDQIQKALDLQKQSASRSGSSSRSLRNDIITWMEGNLIADKFLGEHLMDMDVISPPLLRKGLLHQILPTKMIESMSREELTVLLQISMFWQKIGRGNWLFSQILEMTNELLNCEGGHILLAKTESQEMLVAIPTTPENDQQKSQTFPADKGLAGWVFSHGHPAMVSNVSEDERFDSAIDSNLHGKVETRSILAVPLHINGELIGVMEAINKVDGEFTEHDMNTLTLVANIITVSLESVFRFQEKKF